MKKKLISVALIIALGASSVMTSCIGSFSLTNKLLAWNNTINNKFVNELVFVVFCILPVYEVSSLADLLVLNSIEFWSGTSPVAHNSKTVKGSKGEYLVESDQNGYKVTNTADGSVARFNFDAKQKSWSVEMPSGEECFLFSFVDDAHVRVPGVGGEMQVVELSQQGLYAYESAMMLDKAYAMK